MVYKGSLPSPNYLAPKSYPLLARFLWFFFWISIHCWFLAEVEVRAFDPSSPHFRSGLEQLVIRFHDRWALSCFIFFLFFIIPIIIGGHRLCSDDRGLMLLRTTNIRGRSCCRQGLPLWREGVGWPQLFPLPYFFFFSSFIKLATTVRCDHALVAKGRGCQEGVANMGHYWGCGWP